MAKCLADDHSGDWHYSLRDKNRMEVIAMYLLVWQFALHPRAHLLFELDLVALQASQSRILLRSWRGQSNDFLVQVVRTPL